MSTMVLGTFANAERQFLKEAIERGNESSVFASRTDDARAWLENNPAPRCVFVEGELEGLDSLVAFMRGKASLFSVPVVALVKRVSSHVFSDVHNLGADDVQVRGDYGGLTRRCAVLSEFDPDVRATINQGRCLIMHREHDRRLVLGRVLRQAGFDTVFAADADEMGDLVQRAGPPAMVVADYELPPKGAVHALTRLRRSSGKKDLPAVIMAQEVARSEALEQLKPLGTCALAGEKAPADNVLFLVNDLLTSPEARNARASERHLYDTLCSFRSQGEFEHVFGLTYNISREGLYVRTFDSPQRGTELWFELVPPYGQRAVHLRGSVVWSRGLRMGAGGAAPPGFGVRFEPDSCPPDDWIAYVRGYEQLCESPYAHRF